MDRNEILGVLQSQRPRLKALGVTRIGLFGSRSRGEADRDSDIDFLLDFDPAQKSFTGYMRACELLESLFPAKLDIVTREGVSPRLLPYIERDIIYEDL